MTTTPERAWTIKVKIGGDTFEDAKQLLEHFCDGLHENSNIVSGGCASGGHLTLEKRPEMTHDKYFEQISKRSEEEKV